MKLTISTLSNILKPSFNKKRYLISLLHFAIGLLTLTTLYKIGYLTKNKTVWEIFRISGNIAFFYCLFRAAYLINFQILAELKDNTTPDYATSKAAFLQQRWQLLIIPAIFVGILLLESGLISLIEEIGDRKAIDIIKQFFFTPLTILNLALITFLALGAGLFIPLMVDQKKGAIDTLKAMAQIIKQKFVRVLRIQFVAILIIGIGILLTYFLTDFAIKMQTQSSFIFRKGFLGPIISILKMPLAGSAARVIMNLLFTLNAIAILSITLSYLFNLNMAVYSTYYLDLKENNK